MLLPDHGVGAAWAERKRETAAHITCIERKRNILKAPPVYIDAIFSYSLALLRAESAWLEKTNLFEESDMKDDIKL